MIRRFLFLWAVLLFVPLVATAQEVIVYGGSGARRGADVFRARASSSNRCGTPPRTLPRESTA